MLGDDGSIVRFYEPVSEVRKQTLSERRMHTLLKASENTRYECRKCRLSCHGSSPEQDDPVDTL